ncbi:phosphonate metabolism protein PhnP [Marinobacter fonticola]|uniref:phosphonate metabolism protein PhnP n=1 Tax=Marinobacter fonticola TaxID=2603215 RepID=UPI0011E78B68|nr:phosphonate metabolism protein PhnP [Marinobacter fonticola]
MKLTFLGTGNVRQVPVFGCDCPACERGRLDPQYSRGAASALVEAGDFRILLDAGRHDLVERFQPGDIDAICLTHYHMDHVYGLFRLRWGVAPPIPVYGPPDDTGCDDLFKHHGILNFMPSGRVGEPFKLGPVIVTPLALNHSKVCHGYALECGGQKIAYLTDTVGLPAETEAFLAGWGNFTLIIDCTWPPLQDAPSNHNDLNIVLGLVDRLKPETTWLTHLDHSMDQWLMAGGDLQLPDTLAVARDNLVLE